MKSFRLILIIRVLALTFSIFLLFYIYYNYNLIATEIIIAGLIILQVYFLIRYVNTTNYELAKFFNSIKQSDFNRIIMPKQLGSSFNELNKALSNVIQQFQNTRSETEEQSQYLQTVVKQVGTGLISYNLKGDISLLNNAAKKILGTSDIKNIKNFSSLSSEFVKTLNSIKAGEQELLKLQLNGKQINLSLYASEFKMRGEIFKLVTFQDIRNELERERLEQELEIARQLQLRLLPEKTPSINNYNIQSFCLPAREVGGDYFDFIDLENDKLGIIIGDVAGKGLPAAIYMTLTKGIILSFVNSGITPKEALIKVNRLLYKSIKKGSFVTMIFAVLDFKSNKITVARAGHEPLLHLNDSTINEIKPQGIGLGLERGKIFNTNFEEITFELKEKDILLFYTDGVTDTVDSYMINYGLKRLKEVITKNKELPLAQLITETVHDIKNFSGNVPQYDDLTLIALKRIQ